MRRALVCALLVVLLLPVGADAGVPSDGAQVVASTEMPDMQKQVGALSFPKNAQIVFAAENGKTIEIACSDVTHTAFTTKSKMLKKVAVPAIAAAPFTLGLSLFALAIRGRGYFLAIDYGKGQQVVFSLGKNLYAEQINAASACTGKPTEILK